MVWCKRVDTMCACVRLVFVCAVWCVLFVVGFSLPPHSPRLGLQQRFSDPTPNTQRQSQSQSSTQQQRTTTHNERARTTQTIAWKMPSLDSARCRVTADLRRLYPHIAEWATEKKTRGRHDGCIHIDAAASEDDPNRHIMFEKLQRLCIRTIFVYRVLARIGCGPQHTRFYPCRGTSASVYEWSNLILTSRVAGFTMASDPSFSASPLAAEDSILLALLIACFDLADLPGNRDNWGSQPGSTTDNGTDAHQHAESYASTVTPPNRLAIVDFSFGHQLALGGGFGGGLFFTPHEFFTTASTRLCDTIPKNLTPAELKKRFLSAYGEWFSSPDAFARLLKLASDDACDWFNHLSARERGHDVDPFPRLLTGWVKRLDELNEAQKIAFMRFEAMHNWHFLIPHAMEHRTHGDYDSTSQHHQQDQEDSHNLIQSQSPSLDDRSAVAPIAPDINTDTDIDAESDSASDRSMRHHAHPRLEDGPTPNPI